MISSWSKIRLKRRDRDRNTQGRRPCEDGQDWGDESTNQEMSRMASNHQKLRGRYGTNFSSEPPVGTDPNDTLILDFYPPEFWWNKSLLLWASQCVIICYSSPVNLTHIPNDPKILLLGVGPTEMLSCVQKVNIWYFCSQGQSSAKNLKV